MPVKRKRNKRWNGTVNSTIDMAEYMPPVFGTLFRTLDAFLGAEYTERVKQINKVPCKEKVKARKKK